MSQMFLHMLGGPFLKDTNVKPKSAKTFGIFVNATDSVNVLETH